MHEGPPCRAPSPKAVRKAASVPSGTAAVSGISRRDRARGAAQSRQARHDAAAIGASLRNFRAISGADRKRRRQSVGKRAARHRPSLRSPRFRAIAGEPGRARRRSAPFSICWRKCRKPNCPNCRRLIETRVARSGDTDRAQRIALVGLRGAGKSTLGRMLAQHLGWPFIELDRIVEEDYGASIPDLIEMAGTATFRRHERSALDRVLRANAAAVITTAGGIVSNPRNLCAPAAPQPHDLDQGAAGRSHEPRDGAGRFPPDGAKPRGRFQRCDGRPCRHPRSAARRLCPRRGQLDTSGDAVEQSFAKLLAAVTQLIGPMNGAKP